PSSLHFPLERHKVMLGLGPVASVHLALTSRRADGCARATGLLLICHSSKESTGKCAAQPHSGAYRQASFSDPNEEKQRDGYSNERSRVGRRPVAARSRRTSQRSARYGRPNNSGVDPESGGRR